MTGAYPTFHQPSSCLYRQPAAGGLRVNYRSYDQGSISIVPAQGAAGALFRDPVHYAAAGQARQLLPAVLVLNMVIPLMTPGLKKE